MVGSLIIGFLPWIIFDAMPMQTQRQLDIAVIIALIITVVLNRTPLKRGYILPWGTLLFFLFAFFAVTIFQIDWIAKNIWLYINGSLAIVVWFSLIIGKPFTVQYAKQEVSKDKWNHPVFISINRMLTSIWGLVFLFNFSVNLLKVFYLISGLFSEFITDAASIFAIWFTIWFPKYYREKKWSCSR